MSKINAIRLINLNYNNNAIKISDETFHFNGESTLLSLRNGGGKSVLVQMMMAPFVHKRYRDAKDRPFESYFTTAKPAFILVEWMLDQGAGYVLTGMMVRRNQNTDGEQNENLEMVNIISEYQESCLSDIHHLPVVERDKKEIKLKNFTACRQMFEDFKKDSSLKFFYYNMENAAQSRQYFDKLMEYQINYKEWETIIKKVNLEESGLSNLFSDCRDERGLVEKWFLEAVEGKLNKDRNRMKEFQTITEKYVGQYKDNQSKIKRRDTIRLFKEDGERIEEKALQYEEVEQKKRQQENKIAAFIMDLNTLRDSTRDTLQLVKTDIEDVRQKIEQVAYEKLSGEYYQIQEKQKFHISNRDMIEMEQEQLEREQQKSQNRLHLLLCAKQQNTVTTDQADLEEIRQKRDVCQRKNEDLAPERKYLGHLLKEYHEQLLMENATKQKENREALEQTGKKIAGFIEKEDELELAIRERISREGALVSKVEAYSGREEDFNGRYGENLTRNILGTYEPGLLEIRKENYKQDFEDIIHQQNKRRRQLEDIKEQIKGLERKQDEWKEEQAQYDLEEKQQEQIQAQYEEELKVRSTILTYLDMTEEEQFDTEKILKVSERKLREMEEIIRNLEKEQDALEQEHQKLMQGKVLELPEQLEQEFETLGLHLVYGMEWLKKNGYSEKENKALVKEHPFLPYSLLLSEKELEKLSQHAGDIYTSFPIPIIKREQLEKKSECVSVSNVIDLSDVNFYVLFNENLLDEEKLAQLVREKERQIQKKQETLSIRKTEYKEYFHRKETVRNQSVTLDRYTENVQRLEELEQKIAQCEKKKEKTLLELAEVKEERKTLERQFHKTEKEISDKERKIEDFDQLCDLYESYEQDCKALKKCQQEKKNMEEQKSMIRGLLEDEQGQQKELEIQNDKLIQTEQDLKNSLLCYAEYEEKVELKDNAAIKALSVSDWEARFRAITSNMSQELQDLELQEQKALKRYRKAKEELEHLREKYHLESQAWIGVEYLAKEEAHLEIRLEDFLRKIENKKMLRNEENTQIAVLKKQMDICREQIITECRKEEPLPKTAIQNRDFDAVKNQLLFQQKELQKKETSLGEILQSYEENLTALAEYSEFIVTETVQWKEELSELNREQLRRQKGILVRDYKATVEERRDAKERLTGLLNQIVRKEIFGEEFYKKPLEAMLELTDDASQVLRQLHTTIQSYDSLMEKLEVDISVVEKEKEKIVELMEEYIKDVHQNLGKIDANSTIVVRERPLKMLKIQLPEWEENENLYHIRLLDLMDEITQKGIACFERNENPQEYFGTQITTKNLYDTVIGIGNVQIKLYKIEEQREYPITWAEVAKNSGGEGFLSAFVILSSLLYYMRKDDTDFFADRNEGKVLLMDNPFAQTNASHLLKPLMDMAKKVNTQLICLSGLGGESIYNRFDNIYVLNLIAASLRNGMQYLKVNHVKGNEPETMVVSQIEVVEQMELEF